MVATWSVWSPHGARGWGFRDHEGLQGTRSLECMVLRGLAGVQGRGWAWGCRAGWLGSCHVVEHERGHDLVPPNCEPTVCKPSSPSNPEARPHFLQSEMSKRSRGGTRAFQVNARLILRGRASWAVPTAPTEPFPWDWGWTPVAQQDMAGVLGPVLPSLREQRWEHYCLSAQASHDVHVWPVAHGAVSFGPLSCGRSPRGCRVASTGDRSLRQ